MTTHISVATVHKAVLHFVLKDSGRVKEVINRDVPGDYFEKDNSLFIGPVRNFEKPKRDLCVLGEEK
jgi:hypothetical protein